ncbi:MAG TPA: mechanosensitive ion channel domain-containing protein [Polyangiales bacterium]|nr:mechanosensitive ion channel domain-containing protein [Polyangiales bacterium]
MRRSAQRIRNQAAMGFLFILAFSLSSPAGSWAQEDAEQEQTVEQQIDALVQRIKTRDAELEEMSGKLKSLDESAGAILDTELSERRARQRRDLSELVDLVLAAQDAGADVASARATAVEILKEDSQSMQERMRDLNTANLARVEIIEKGAPGEAEKARNELNESLAVSNRLLNYMDANFDQQEKLGVDVTEDAEAFKKRLEMRAAMVSALLQNAKTKIDEITARPGASEDAEAQKTLSAVKKNRDILAETQRVNVRLMDEYGLETAQLKQGIISATGKLSQDVLNKDVASGLIGDWFEDAGDWLRTNGASLVFQALVFLLILFAFWILARIARGAVRRGLERSKVQASSLAKDFFVKMTGGAILLLGLIIAVAQLGVEVGPVLAGLGIAGFVIGFALQDTLSNFASGLMILVYRPFDVGDAVEAGGVLGAVNQMNLVSTMILTFDNQLLIVPNKQIWGGVIRNITHQTTRRVDLTFGIGYSDDIPKAEKVLNEIVSSHEKVLEEPKPVVKLHELGESSVNFIVRPWSKTEDYWDVYWDVTREVKRRFDEEGISIPFPQRDVHIYNQAGGGEEA